MAATNSDTRSISVFSSALMFSCEPVSTSCSMMLASRSRSNRAVVSARSILCVSIISLTVVDAVSFDFVDRLGGGVLQLVERAVDRVGGAFAGGVDHAGDLGAVVDDRTCKREALLLDRGESNIGRGGDVDRELLALLGDGAQARRRSCQERMALISSVRFDDATRAISSALPAKLRAISSLTPVKVRSASLALERIASVVESASAPSDFSASEAFDLIAWLSCSMRGIERHRRPPWCGSRSGR